MHFLCGLCGSTTHLPFPSASHTSDMPMKLTGASLSCRPFSSAGLTPCSRRAAPMNTALHRFQSSTFLAAECSVSLKGSGQAALRRPGASSLACAAGLQDSDSRSVSSGVGTSHDRDEEETLLVEYSSQGQVLSDSPTSMPSTVLGGAPDDLESTSTRPKDYGSIGFDGSLMKSWPRVVDSPRQHTALPPPKYRLNFTWTESHIGVAVDQVYSRGQVSPLTEFFFWPHKDAWEELRISLDERPWISPSDRVVLLNRTTEVINAWQQDAVKPSLQQVRATFPDCSFLGSSGDPLLEASAA